MLVWGRGLSQLKPQNYSVRNKDFNFDIMQTCCAKCYIVDGLLQRVLFMF